jgi:CheY-like chemotaxis protein
LKRVIANAASGAQRAVVLTQRLLAFARRQPLDPKIVNVNGLLQGMSEFFQRTLSENIHVEIVGGAGLWQVEVDPSQMEAAILNLVVNARDAMQSHGKLTIETSNAFIDESYAQQSDIDVGQYVLISVTDDGPGMPKDVQERAFDPFFTTKEPGQGTGLGLSQVYGFVKQSGGHVKIYSEVGEGSTIKVYLPRSTGQADEIANDRHQIVGSKGDETIMVVEDDPDVRSYLVETLEGLNYQVRAASNADAALRDFAEDPEPFDLLLTDIVMPGINGRLLADEMTKLLPGLKVLFITGYSRNAIVHQGRLDSGVSLLQKPVTQAALGGKIREMLDRP